ncbi:uncharacterized protein LOC128894844 [Hylaeus anthracinus]|uniref:uncharacterized protein LOC128894844 n=1 Tax=Hylaeus anthracinus TaxID=313031 RepID=UPI0023B8C038|nr:uncharacterized protein LOC128894844 [Hylaeus anthracinus]
MDKNKKHKVNKESFERISVSGETEGSSKSFPVLDEAVPNNLIHRVCRKPPRSYKKGRDEIPFFIPHKKLLEKIDHKPEIREPLTGFTDQQEKIRREMCKPSTLPVVTETVDKVSTKDVAVREIKRACNIPAFL